MWLTTMVLVCVYGGTDCNIQKQMWFGEETLIVRVQHTRAVIWTVNNSAILRLDYENA